MYIKKNAIKDGATQIDPNLALRRKSSASETDKEEDVKEDNDNESKISFERLEEESPCVERDDDKDWRGDDRDGDDKDGNDGFGDNTENGVEGDDDDDDDDDDNASMEGLEQLSVERVDT